MRSQSSYIELVIVIIVFFGFVGYALLNDSKDAQLSFEENYYQVNFHGILVNKWVNRGIKVRLEADGKIQKYFLKSSKNYNYSPNDLYYFIQKGDSLYKQPDSYDLFIYRDGRKYHFKLGEYIN